MESFRPCHDAQGVMQPRDDLTAPRLAELAMLDDAKFRQMFAASPIKRIGRNRFVRNVLNAIGNSGDPALRPAADRLTTDTDPVVAEAAQWAAARLGLMTQPNVLGSELCCSQDQSLPISHRTVKFRVICVDASAEDSGIIPV